MKFQIFSFYNWFTWPPSMTPVSEYLFSLFLMLGIGGGINFILTWSRDYQSVPVCIYVLFTTSFTNHKNTTITFTLLNVKTLWFSGLFQDFLKCRSVQGEEKGLLKEPVSKEPVVYWMILTYYVRYRGFHEKSYLGAKG